jgi:hypothetical protein
MFFTCAHGSGSGEIETARLWLSSFACKLIAHDQKKFETGISPLFQKEGRR